MYLCACNHRRWYKFLLIFISVIQKFQKKNIFCFLASQVSEWVTTVAAGDNNGSLMFGLWTHPLWHGIRFIPAGSASFGF